MFVFLRRDQTIPASTEYGLTAMANPVRLGEELERNGALAPAGSKSSSSTDDMNSVSTPFAFAKTAWDA